MPPVSNDRSQVLDRVATVPVWRHRIDVGSGVTTPGTEDCHAEMARLRFPASFTGRRVLDVGCSDGFYAFEAKARGASEVVAVDDESSLLAGQGNGFQVAAELLDSSVDYRILDVHGIDAGAVGTFDDVIFLNVLYHLQNPVAAMKQLRSVARPDARLFLKTIVWQDVRVWLKGRPLGFDLSQRPKFWFFPGTELGGDPTNWWAPNRAGIEALLSATGWGGIERLARHGDRLYYRARAV